MEGKGEGGRGEKEEREGHVFLTFRMVIGRVISGVDLGSAWKVTCTHLSNFVHDIASKKNVFSAAKQHFSLKSDPLFGES